MEVEEEGGGWRNRTRRWPRCRPPRIFLSIANESSPVILISGGPPGIVIYRIIAIVGWNRRNRSARSVVPENGPSSSNGVYKCVCVCVRVSTICAEGRKEGIVETNCLRGNQGKDFFVIFVKAGGSDGKEEEFVNWTSFELSDG